MTPLPTSTTGKIAYVVLHLAGLALLGTLTATGHATWSETGPLIGVLLGTGALGTLPTSTASSATTGPVAASPASVPVATPATPVAVTGPTGIGSAGGTSTAPTG